MTTYPITLRQKLGGMLTLYRPELPIAAALFVIAGQVLAAGSLPALRPALLGFLCVFCLSASALIFNDVFDYEVDLVNAPGRPLPSGRVTRREAVGLGIGTTLVGFVAALLLGWIALLGSVLIWLVGFLYNWRYKEAGLPGNLMVALSVASTFVFGAISVQAPWNAFVWVFSAMAFFFDLGEEIAGDAMDMQGDRLRSSRSIALQKGRRFAMRITVVLWSMVILLSLLLVSLGWLGPIYLALILLMDAVLVYFSTRLLQAKDEDSGHKAMRGAYLAMTVCVLALLVGRLVG